MAASSTNNISNIVLYADAEGRNNFIAREYDHSIF